MMRSRTWTTIGWLLALMLWGGAAFALARLPAYLQTQEEAILDAAYGALALESRVLAGWQHWDRVQPPVSSMWLYFPEDPALGRALVRFLPQAPHKIAQQAWRRLSFNPVLVKSWYRGVSSSALTSDEIALLAWVHFVNPQLLMHLPEFKVAEAIALHPSLRAEVAGRCPHGCPPFTGAREGLLMTTLVGMLDDSDPRVARAAQATLALAGPWGSSQLEAQLKSEDSAHGRARAFFALSGCLDAASRRALIQEALQSPHQNLRVVGLMEALRTLQPALLPPDPLFGPATPAGLPLFESYARGLLAGLPLGG